jgi:hypothetical protein
MINWFKGLFGFPTKSEVIRDTILTLAKDRTLLESALSLSDEIEKSSQQSIRIQAGREINFHPVTGDVKAPGMTLAAYNDLCKREEEEGRKAKRRVYQRQYRMRKKQEQKGKPTPVTVLGFCVDATPRIAELASQGMKQYAIARTLRRDGFLYESKNSGGLKPFDKIHVAYLINGRTVYNSEKKMYVSSDRYLQYQRDIKVRQKGKKK